MITHEIHKIENKYRLRIYSQKFTPLTIIPTIRVAASTGSYKCGLSVEALPHPDAPTGIQKLRNTLVNICKMIQILCISTGMTYACN